MPGISKRTFDFDKWKELAESNPEAFEFNRQRVIEALLAKTKHSDRLRRLQWRIDVERDRSKTPISACLRLSSMMLDSVYGETGLANALHGKYHNKNKTAEVVDLASHRQDGQD